MAERAHGHERRVREKPIPASLLALCDGHWGKGVSTDKDDFPEFDLYVKAISLIANPDLPWKEWKTVIMAIWATFVGNADGLAAAHALSRKRRQIQRRRHRSGLGRDHRIAADKE